MASILNYWNQGYVTRGRLNKFPREYSSEGRRIRRKAVNRMYENLDCIRCCRGKSGGSKRGTKRIEKYGEEIDVWIKSRRGGRGDEKTERKRVSGAPRKFSRMASSKI